MIVKNLRISSRTELTITLTRFFLVTSFLQKQKCEKTEYKERLEKQMKKNLNFKYKKISKSSSKLFFTLFKKRNRKTKTQDTIPNLFITNMVH